MALSQTILDAVNTAFAAADDVKETITLRYEPVGSFDHVNQVPVKGTSVEVACEAIQTSRTVSKEGDEQVSYIVRFEDVPLEQYQTLETGYGTYRVTSFSPTMNFIVEVSATRGKTE